MNTSTLTPRWFITGLLLAAVCLLLAVPVSAQDDMMTTPSVEVTDQNVLDGTVTIASTYLDVAGFIVIHIDNGEGAPGPVIGNRLLSPGANTNVSVPIDASAATPTLFAMLHFDDNEAGVYEFGSVEGADGPVIVDGAPVTPAFNVAVINAYDQFITDDTFTAASVTVSESGWLVIHSEAEGRPGPVLGQTQIEPGINTDVSVALDPAGLTQNLWPMLHVDTGEAGVYEFGTVEGADGPVRMGDAVATTSVATVPTVRISPQIAVYGDGMDMMMAPSVTAWSVLSDGPGWLVIHSEADGGPGPVAGFAQVEAGLNMNVTVELDPAVATPVLWPMLHVDTGEAGVYEFGTVEGADGPVRVNDAVLTFPIAAAPSIVYEVEWISENELKVSQALIDAPGWLVIHVDNEGSPGPVAGYAPLTPGLNTDIVITIDDPSMVTATVFPMLHYDTGEAGAYEFGAVEGADGPVRVGEAVVVGPAEVMAMMEG